MDPAFSFQQLHPKRQGAIDAMLQPLENCHPRATFILVWTKPVSLLAKDFGVSDVAIAKWCKKMEIPKPPRGYWAKKKVKKWLPKQPKLKALSNVGVDRITYVPRPEGLKPASSTHEQVQVVPGSLEAPHKLIQHTLTALKKGKPDEKGILRSRNKRLLDINVSAGQLDRACLAFDSLIKTFEEEGIKCVLEQGEHDIKTVVTIKGVRVCLGIDESSRRIDYIPTEKEKTDQTIFFTPHKYDFIPSGKLVIKLRDAPYGARQKWEDGIRQRVENCAKSVVRTLRHIVILARKAKIERIKRDQERQRELEATRRRRLEEQKAEKMTAHMKQWQITRDLNSYLDELEKRLDQHPEIEEYLSWGRDFADRMNPIRHPEKLNFKKKGKSLLAPGLQACGCQGKEPWRHNEHLQSQRIAGI